MPVQSDGMNYVMNWIQEDDFNLLHRMQIARFSLLHSMRGAKCTICEVQSLSICWKLIVLQRRMNVPSLCLLYMQSTGCIAEYFTAAGHFYKTSTSAIEFVSRQPNTVTLLSIRFEVLNWYVSAWRCWTRGGITSIPTSFAPRLCCVCAALQSVSVCFALQIVQSASLHSFNF